MVVTHRVHYGPLHEPYECYVLTKSGDTEISLHTEQLQICEQTDKLFMNKVSITKSILITIAFRTSYHRV